MGRFFSVGCLEWLKNQRSAARNFFRRYCANLILSFIFVLPYFLLATFLGQRIITLALGYYLKAEKVELLDEHSGAIFHQVSTKLGNYQVTQATIGIVWDFKWHLRRPLKIKNFWISGAKVRIRAFPSTLKKKDLEGEPAMRLPWWARWTPSLELEQLSIRDCSISMEKQTLNFSKVEVHDMKLSLLSSSAKKGEAPIELISKRSNAELSQQLRPEFLTWSLARLEEGLKRACHYKSIFQISIESLQGELSQSRSNQRAQTYQLALSQLELAPSHLQYKALQAQDRHFAFFSDGSMIFAKASPFRLNLQLASREFEALPLAERSLVSAVIESEEEFGSGFKIRGAMSKNLFQFQSILFRECGLLISDLNFCFKFTSQRQCCLRAHTVALGSNQRIGFFCNAEREVEKEWKLSGSCASTGPLDLKLTFLPYCALRDSKLSVHPQLQFHYGRCLKEELDCEMEQLKLSGELKFASGEFKITSVNLDKSLPQVLEEETILDAPYANEELFQKIETEHLNAEKKKSFWRRPQICFDPLDLIIEPEVKLIFLNIEAALEGKLRLSKRLEAVRCDGKLEALPLSEHSAFESVPLSFKEGRLSITGKAMDGLDLELQLAALPNARGKQLPFELFSIKVANNMLTVFAQKRGAVHPIILFSISLNYLQLSLNNLSSENLVPFLSAMLLGSLGDFVRGLVPLERAEQALGALISRSLPLLGRANVQLMQPCMKELNRFLLQLIIIDWNNALNARMEIDFPLAGVSAQESKSWYDDSNGLALIFEWLSTFGASVALELLPSLKISGAYQFDLNRLFEANSNDVALEASDLNASEEKSRLNS